MNTGNHTVHSFSIVLLVASFVLVPQSTQKRKSSMQTSTVGGEKISYGLKSFSPPLVITLDETMLNQSSPLSCSYLLYSLLAKGDIEAASKLSNDPEKTKAKYTRYKERIGEQEFKKMMADYFGGKAFATLTGDVAAVRAAVDSGAAVCSERGLLVNKVVIPNPRKELLKELI